jgi:hypothetical protein
MTHRNYKPRKPSLFDRQIAAQKSDALIATMQNVALKGAIIGMMYGSAIVEVPERSALLIRLRSPLEAPSAHSYSDQGDFTEVYRGGFH